MNLPGFTAEDSDYRTNMRYRAAASFAGFSPTLAILPARSCTECFCDVVDFGLPGTCAKLCFDKPGDLEFPVICPADQCNPRCDQPICGPCTRSCSYPGGGSFTQSC
jgi:hypothetical protein